MATKTEYFHVNTMTLYKLHILKGNIFHSRFVLLLNFFHPHVLYVMQASLDTGLLNLLRACLYGSRAGPLSETAR